MKISHILPAIFLSISVSAAAQEFTPLVTQFTKGDYGAANQNWALGQDPDGIIYIGNGDGLLSYDGVRWTLTLLPRGKTVRSLWVDSSGRIYTGSFEEFGYFEKDCFGTLHYTSLSQQLNGYEWLNDEIWTIQQWGDAVIFQSFTSWFIYHNGIVEAKRSEDIFMFFSQASGKLYTDTGRFGVAELDPLTREFRKVSGVPFSSRLITTLPYGEDEWLFVTYSDGLFIFDGESFRPFRTGADNWLKTDQVNRAAISRDGTTIVVGTILGGAIAFDRRGEKLWTVNTGNVLQNNTVLGLFFDTDDNLWIALDKGIALVSTNPSILHISSFNPSVGSIYTAAYRPPYLYLGTNQGLYRAEYSPLTRRMGRVTPDSTVSGHVWDISLVDGELICGTNRATLSLTADGTRIMSPVEGGMCLGRGRIHRREVLVQGTYTFITIYTRGEAEGWQYSHSLTGMMNPIKHIAVDYTGTIWAGHLHRGLYALRLSQDLSEIESITHFHSLDGANERPIGVFVVEGRVVFSDGVRFYTYDDIHKEIVPYDELNDALGSFASAYRICPAGGNRYWFITPGAAGLFAISSGEGERRTEYLKTVSYSWFGDRWLDGEQNAVPLSVTTGRADDGKGPEVETLFTLENGLALYAPDDTMSNSLPKELKIRNVVVSDPETGEERLLPIYPRGDEKVSFEYAFRNVGFSLYFPEYPAAADATFTYRLEGYDRMPQQPVTMPDKQYYNLPYGKYTFHATVSTRNGIELDSVSYPFEISPPLLLSATAKLLYVLLSLLAVYCILLYIRLLIRRRHRQVVTAQQERINALERLNLESEVKLKSKELAASTMELIKKNEVLIGIRTELTSQKEALGTQYPAKYYRKLTGIIDRSLSSEDDWVVFQANFDRIHENFFRNLVERYPSLTPGDLRFCACLRLNLSSKDIASLMNISLKGVEVARYRIRKKLGLPSEKSLSGFLIEFK